MTAARIEHSFAGAILCVITVILISFTFNNNEWLTVLSAHPQISPPWWWDNQKMRARKTLRTAGWRRSLLAAALASKVKLMWRHWSRSNRTNQRPGRITIVVQLNHVSWFEFHDGATYHDLNLVQIYDKGWTWFSWTEIWSTLVKCALSLA